ncbi:Uncharacterised protein [uncultured archaeon]|nr:Uncharacterised protein [uncultured archaeon]
MSERKYFWHIVLILFLIVLFASPVIITRFSKSDINGKVTDNSYVYNADPFGIADNRHVLFVDKNNPKCNNSYTREDVMNPETPWCDNLRFGKDNSAHLYPGDKVFFRSGEYFGGVYINSSGTSENPISFEAYPKERVTLNCGKIFNNWKSLGGGVYNIIINKSELDPNSVNGIKKEGLALVKVSDYSDLINSNEFPENPLRILSKYDLIYANRTETNYNTNVTIKLAIGTPKEVFLADSGDRIEIGSDSKYIEIKDFKIQYCYDGIKSYSPHIRIINNSLEHIVYQGILMPVDDLYIDGNNISYIGQPLKFFNSSERYIENNLAHGIFIAGNKGVIINNIIKNCYNGCLYIGSENIISNNYQVYNNYIENGVSIEGKEINRVNFYNNIIFGDSYGLRLGVKSEVKVYNNLIIGNSSQEVINAYAGDNSSMAEVEIKNNIITSLSPTYCYELNSTLDYSKTKIDNNIYYGCKYFSVNYTKKTVPGYSFDNFNNYKSLMNSWGLENNSIYADPKLDKNIGILRESPAIDKGICINGLDIDYHLNHRPTGESCDIGPFEYRNLCGNMVCNDWESCYSCPTDCGICPNIYKSSGKNESKNQTDVLEKPLGKSILEFIEIIKKPIENLISKSIETIKKYAFYLIRILIFLILVVVVQMSFIKLKKIKEDKKKKEILMIKAKYFVEEMKKKKYSDEQIKKMFSEKGWKKEAIDQLILS